MSPLCFATRYWAGLLLRKAYGWLCGGKAVRSDGLGGFEAEGHPSVSGVGRGASAPKRRTD